MEDPLAYPYPSFNIKEQVIHEQCRQLIANVAAFMKNEAELFKQTMQIIIPITSYKERVIAATGISEETYSKIVKEPEQVTTVISDTFPTQGVKRKHDNLEAFVKEHVNEIESVSTFQIKEEIMAPEQIVEDFEIETVPIAEADIQIKDEVTTDLLKEEEICATSETVYVPSFQSEEALSTVNEMCAFQEKKLPSDVEEEASEAVSKLLPQKSLMIYEREYTCFHNWKSAKNINSVSEKVLLAYFSEKSKKVKPSTLWSYYSMLKCTLLANENHDISKYSQLITLLKKLSEGYKPKKSKIFEPVDVIRFLKEASDDDYLFMKVVAIMGLFGACRSDDLYRLEVLNVDDRYSVMVVSLLDAKTKKDRSFCITDEQCGVSVLGIVRKYVTLRPKDVPHKKFFINYRKKKCTIQPVGINTFYKVPKKIADFLKLPNSEMYTGHCFRRSAATMLANSGADFMTVKRMGGWK